MTTARRRLLSGAVRAAGYVWPGPFTLAVLALLVAPLALLRSRVRVVSGVVEVTGGLLVRGLAGLVPGGSVSAITLGHVVLARTDEDVERLRAHERVHVAQWARGGLLFPFAYFGASLLALLRGRDPYLDNPFERAAFETQARESAPPA